MSRNCLTFDVRDQVALITLERPDDANALTLEMARELLEVAIACDSRRDIRAVVLTAEGKMFCAGGDLRSFSAQGENLPAHITETATILHSAIIRFQHMDAPLIVGVNGTAAGAGFSLALSGDIVMAARSAKFVSAYTASGLSPDGSSTFFLAKHVGLLRAKELALTNRVLTAEEAQQWGIVTRVVDDAALMDEARAMAMEFAKGPTRAFGQTKRLLLTAFNARIEAQLEAETQGIVAMTRTKDGPHGIDAFANKRKPEFEGK